MALNTKDLLNLKDIIEELYTDGISAIISAEMDSQGESIIGIFRDGRKLYEFRINPDGKTPKEQISYKLQNPEVLQNDSIDEDPEWLWKGDRLDAHDFVTFIEMGVRLDKAKNCRNSTACGKSCISSKKVCSPAKLMSMQTQEKAKDLKEKLKKEPAVKTAKPKKEVAAKTEPKAEAEPKNGKSAQAATKKENASANSGDADSLNDKEKPASREDLQRIAENTIKEVKDFQAIPFDQRSSTIQDMGGPASRLTYGLDYLKNAENGFDKMSPDDKFNAIDLSINNISPGTIAKDGNDETAVASRIHTTAAGITESLFNRLSDSEKKEFAKTRGSEYWGTSGSTPKNAAYARFQQQIRNLVEENDREEEARRRARKAAKKAEQSSKSGGDLGGLFG